MNKIIVVSGNIGAGKTSLIELLSKKFGYTPYFELVNNNPYLPLFYEDMKRWAFNLETFFLTGRVKQYVKMMESEGINIADRTVFEGRYVFVENLYRTGALSDTDYKTYLGLYELMIEFLRPPDLVVYLRTTPDIAKERILTRGREWEKGIDIEYLRQVHGLYEEYIKEISGMCPIVTIDMDKLNPLYNQRDLEEITQKVENSFATV